ncbi:hypothetical protein [Methanobacterium alcaliphilum]|uniref:hypothetical protein n=1 Tax=Methanobacterium alcaliphilum TaxID=392018 RepID=UPI00200A882C|nr:hypothetical protein [Methanobacterium alcaliphilum]MCK9152257.1 hypothetical protein [Methanobacterium alcaliphilum]
MKNNYYIVKFKHKARSDSICIRVLGDPDYKESFEIEPHLKIYFNHEKKPMAFKISDPSLLLELNKKNLLKAISEVQAEIKIDEKSISFCGRFYLSIDNDKIEKPFKIESPNTKGIPEIHSNFTSVGFY